MPPLILRAEQAERTELAFWRTSPTERPSANSIDNVLNKAAEARVFLEKLRRFHSYFAGASRALEMGAGQGWASCIVKRFFPECKVIATDLSPAAIAGMPIWPPIFGGRPDGAAACRAYCAPFADASFDLIFAFAAAHHFRRYRSAVTEVARLLRPGGAALFFHEPTCREMLHASAFRRVNRKRPDVPEDVLVPSRLRRFAAASGLESRFRFAPTGTNREAVPGAYYLLLRSLPLLQTLLPCTADIELYKPAIKLK